MAGKRKARKLPFLHPDRIVTRRLLYLFLGVLIALWLVVSASIGLREPWPRALALSTLCVALFTGLFLLSLCFSATIAWVASKILRLKHSTFGMAFKMVVAQLVVGIAVGVATILAVFGAMGGAWLANGVVQLCSLILVAIALLAGFLACIVAWVKVTKHGYGTGYAMAIVLNLMIFALNTLVNMVFEAAMSAATGATMAGLITRAAGG